VGLKQAKIKPKILEKFLPWFVQICGQFDIWYIVDISNESEY
jgi:hypothetical protein